MTAEYIKTLPTVSCGGILQELWLLTEQEYDLITRKYVVISSASHDSFHETYIFSANKDGEITDWVELPGSVRQYKSAYVLLKELNYEIV